MPIAVPDTVRQLVDGLVDAAVVLDSERRVLFHNRGYEALCPVKGPALAKRIAAGARCDELFAARDAQESHEVSAVPLVVEGHQIVVETYRDVSGPAPAQRCSCASARPRPISRRRSAGTAGCSRRRRPSSCTSTRCRASAGWSPASRTSSTTRSTSSTATSTSSASTWTTCSRSSIGGRRRRRCRPTSAPARRGQARDRVRLPGRGLAASSCARSAPAPSGPPPSCATSRTSRATGGGDMRETDVIAGIETTLNLISPLHPQPDRRCADRSRRTSRRLIVQRRATSTRCS